MVMNLTNVPYRFRQFHPVIDAVGKFAMESNRTALVFLQVSMSKYEDHKTKIENLVGDRSHHKGYRELRGSNEKSVL